jgi:hypothetical protein
MITVIIILLAIIALCAVLVAHKITDGGSTVILIRIAIGLVLLAVAYYTIPFLIALVVAYWSQIVPVALVLVAVLLPVWFLSLAIKSTYRRKQQLDEESKTLLGMLTNEKDKP